MYRVCAGPPSTTLVQQWTNIEPTYRVCWVRYRYYRSYDRYIYIYREPRFLLLKTKITIFSPHSTLKVIRRLLLTFQQAILYITRSFLSVCDDWCITSFIIRYVGDITWNSETLIGAYRLQRIVQVKIFLKQKWYPQIARHFSYRKVTEISQLICFKLPKMGVAILGIRPVGMIIVSSRTERVNTHNEKSFICFVSPWLRDSVRMLQNQYLQRVSLCTHCDLWPLIIDTLWRPQHQ